METSKTTIPVKSTGDLLSATEFNQLNDKFNLAVDDIEAHEYTLSLKADLVGGKVPESQLPAQPANTGNVTGPNIVVDEEIAIYNGTSGKIIKKSGLTITQLNDALADIAFAAPIEDPAFQGTVTGITAEMVGLGNVDNTADVDKPVSSAVTLALADKQDVSTLGADAAEALKSEILSSTPLVADVSGVEALDFGITQAFDLTVTGDTTIANPTNVVPQSTYMMALTQDDIGGHTVVWGMNFYFKDGIAPTFSTDPGTIDLCTIYAQTPTRLLVTTDLGFKSQPL